ncbi:MAG TPA: RNA methyltransferase [Mycobacteriales bacterium]|jgi:TrmH family RNA methyltransferase|nr:RNA methyltransferase [Mycobacteriales bacterium]
MSVDAEPLGPRSASVKAARQLTQRKHRDLRREFLAEGRQAVSEALRSGVVRILLLTPQAHAAHADLIDAARTCGCAIVLVTREAAATLSETVTPQNLIAVCHFVDVPLERVLGSSPRLVAVLDRVQDPGNAGTVLRVADAAGADAVIFGAASVDPYNGKCIRASAGSVFHPTIVRGVDCPQAVAALRTAGVQVLAADAHAAETVDDLGRGGGLAAPTAWLLGNEAQGLSPELRTQADRCVRIPIYGQAESLNLAVAAALCLYASASAQPA